MPTEKFSYKSPVNPGQRLNPGPYACCLRALPISSTPGALLKGKTHLLGDGKTGFNSRFTEYTQATYRNDFCLHDTNDKSYLCVK